jgi:Glycosyltransferase family 87
MVAPLASLPYWLVHAVFQGLSLALYLGVIATILRTARQRVAAIASSWLPVGAAYPAVFINLGHGQNGFLTAGIFGAALVVFTAFKPELIESQKGLAFVDVVKVDIDKVLALWRSHDHMIVPDLSEKRIVRHLVL